MKKQGLIVSMLVALTALVGCNSTASGEDISFDEKYMYGKILSDKESTIDYKIVNGNLNYIKENNKIYECVEVIRIEIDKKTKKEIKKEKLYDEKVLIKYELPSDVKVEEM